MIKSFEEFVQIYCPNVSKEDALEYAARGKSFLQEFSETDNINENLSVVSPCIMWCLFKQAYDNNIAFGRGMFNLASDEDTKTFRLYNLLINYPRTYKRASTHYRERGGLFCWGLDNNYHSDIEFVPLPFKYTTVCYNLCREPDGSISLFIKPENYGTKDLKSKILHGKDYAKHLFAREKMPGTIPCREDDEMRKEMKGDIIQTGNEVRYIFGINGLSLKPKKTYEEISDKLDESIKSFMQSKIDDGLKKETLSIFRELQKSIDIKLEIATQTQDKKHKKIIRRILDERILLVSKWTKIFLAKNNKQLLSLIKDYLNENNTYHKKDKSLLFQAKIAPSSDPLYKLKRLIFVNEEDAPLVKESISGPKHDQPLTEQIKFVEAIKQIIPEEEYSCKEADGKFSVIDKDTNVDILEIDITNPNSVELEHNGSGLCWRASIYAAIESDLTFLSFKFVKGDFEDLAKNFVAEIESITNEILYKSITFDFQHDQATTKAILDALQNQEPKVLQIFGLKKVNNVLIIDQDEGLSEDRKMTARKFSDYLVSPKPANSNRM